VLLEDVYTSKGVKDMVAAGSPDNLCTIDADTGKLLWKKSFSVEGNRQQPR
jgi:hypothetical protein